MRHGFRVSDLRSALIHLKVPASFTIGNEQRLHTESARKHFVLCEHLVLIKLLVDEVSWQ